MFVVDLWQTEEIGKECNVVILHSEEQVQAISPFQIVTRVDEEGAHALGQAVEGMKMRTRPGRYQPASAKAKERGKPEVRRYNLPISRRVNRTASV